MTSNTTRRHPRSLIEAFPRTAEYGCAITLYRPGLLERFWRFFGWR